MSQQPISGPIRTEHITVPARARAGTFTAVTFVVAAVAVALLLVANTSGNNLPPAAGPTTSDVIAAEPEDADPPTSTTVPPDDGADVRIVVPSNISVQVANSTAVSGAAGRVTDTLKARGYITLNATNATAGTQAVTKIHYREGALLEAHAIAEELETGT